MAEPSNHEAVFIENLALIDRVAPSLGRRNGLGADDVEDFVSWVKLRMVEDEYAVFKKFRGESSLATYLTVVIAMLARDYRVRRFGRWRPSAAAQRVGAVAVKLEVLVRRQGFRIEQAGEALRTAGDTQLSDRELQRLLSNCPIRPPIRPVEIGAEPLRALEAGGAADVLIITEELEQVRLRTWEALREVIESFPLEERVILRMRFWDELSVADIARALSVDQKPLYRRIERLLADLRRELLARGVDPAECRSLLEEAGK